MKLAEMIKTGGFSALAAAMAMAALPDDAIAKRDSDRGSWSNGSRSESRSSAPQRQSYQPRTPNAAVAPQRSVTSSAPRDNPQRNAETYRRPNPATIRRAEVPPSAAQYRPTAQPNYPAASANASRQAQRTYADTNRNRSYTDANRDRSYGAYNRSSTRTADNYTAYGNRSGYRDRDGDRDRNRDYRSNSRDYRYDRDRDYDRWNRGWRDNRRYDWHDYRNRHRSVFRLGFYYAPYSYWSYRPLSIGFYLDSLFYSSRYWIDDPWRYRLPEVYGPYRWVRYYDDVLLVDIYSGEVVDVIHNFFW